MSFPQDFVDGVRSALKVSANSLLAHALEDGDREVVELLLRHHTTLDPETVCELINAHEPKKVLEMCGVAEVAKVYLDVLLGIRTITRLDLEPADEQEQADDDQDVDEDDRRNLQKPDLDDVPPVTKDDIT